MEERSAPHISILYFVSQSHLVTLPLLYAHFRILLRRLRNQVRTVGAAQCGGGRGSLPGCGHDHLTTQYSTFAARAGKRQERSTGRVRQRNVRRKLLPERHVWHEYELIQNCDMHYRKLGATEAEISEIGYGAWGVGGKQWLGGQDNESLRALSSDRLS